MFFKLLQFILGFLAIGLIVFLHELGHYYAARFFKVEVEVLSYGMGPRIFSIYGKNTEFRLSLFPFGGYCRMKGSIDLEKALRDEKDSIILKEDGSYFAATPLSRIFIYLAGPLTNYLLAFLLLLIAAVIPVERISNDAYITPIDDYPSLFPVSIHQSGIEKGDLVLAVDGNKIEDYQEFVRALPKDGKDVELLILRDGKEQIITIHPSLNGDTYSYGLTLYQDALIGSSSVPELRRGDRIVKVNGNDVYSTLDVYSASESNEYILTIERDGNLFTFEVNSSQFPFSWNAEIVRRRDVPLRYAIPYAFEQTNNFLLTTLEALGALITLNVSDARSVITGPINAAESIGSISTEAFSVSSNSGIRTLCYLLAIVSISLCIGNILPIPTFDGGQILICVAEIIRHGGLKARTYLHLQIIGMILALLIMVGMYYFDIKDYFHF